MGIGDWGLGIGGLGNGPNPQSPIPNPQSPKRNKYKIILLLKPILFLIKINIKISKSIFNTKY